MKIDVVVEFYLIGMQLFAVDALFEIEDGRWTLRMNNEC